MPITIDEIRQQYPQYNDLSANELADKMHAKFYPDMPKQEFYNKVGYKGSPDAGQMIDPTTGMTFDTLKHAATVPIMAAKGIPVLGAAVPDTKDTQQMEEEHPGLAAATRGVGSALSMAPAMAMAPEVFGLGAGSLLANTAAGIGSGAAIGGADAAARGEPIVQGAVTGGLTAGAAPMIGKGIGAIFQNVARWLSPKATGALEGIDPQALEWASKVAKESGLTEQNIAQKIDQLGPQGFLAEYAPGFKSVAQQVAAGSGKNKAEMVKAFEDRVAPDAVKARTDEGLNSLLGKPINRVQQTIEDIEERKGAADPLFKQWKSTTVQPTDELKALVTGLEEKGFLKEANELAEARKLAGKEVPSMKNFFTTGERKDWPTAESYGYLRSAISNRLAGEKNPDLIRAWRGVRDRLDKAIEESNQPAAKVWKQAREEWGNRSEVMKAREAGNNAWSTGYTFEQLAHDVSQMSPAERAAFKENARAALAAKADTTASGDKSLRTLLKAPDAQKKLHFLAENKQVSAKDVESFLNTIEREPEMAQSLKDLKTSTQKLSDKNVAEMMGKKPTLPEKIGEQFHYSPEVTPIKYLDIFNPLKKFAERRQAERFERGRESLAPILTKQGKQAEDLVRALLNYHTPDQGALAQGGRQAAGMAAALARPNVPPVPVPFLPKQFGGTQ